MAASACAPLPWHLVADNKPTPHFADPPFPHKRAPVQADELAALRSALSASQQELAHSQDQLVVLVDMKARLQRRVDALTLLLADKVLTDLEWGSLWFGARAGGPWVRYGGDCACLKMLVACHIAQRAKSAVLHLLDIGNAWAAQRLLCLRDRRYAWCVGSWWIMQ